MLQACIKKRKKKKQKKTIEILLTVGKLRVTLSTPHAVDVSTTARPNLSAPQRILHVGGGRVKFLILEVTFKGAELLQPNAS